METVIICPEVKKLDADIAALEQQLSVIRASKKEALLRSKVTCNGNTVGGRLLSVNTGCGKQLAVNTLTYYILYHPNYNSHDEYYTTNGGYWICPDCNSKNTFSNDSETTGLYYYFRDRKDGKD